MDINGVRVLIGYSITTISGIYISTIYGYNHFLFDSARVVFYWFWVYFDIGSVVKSHKKKQADFSACSLKGVIMYIE